MNEKLDEDSKESSKEKSSSFSFDSNTGKSEYNLKIESSFNIFEIIITEFFKCCMCKRLSMKNKINENANKVLNKKLDIITYIRNMILFDIMNKTILDNEINDIINFLCRPIISLKNNQKKEFNKFYKNYQEKDFNKFNINIQALLQKPKIEERENKLISYSKEHLKKFL